MSSDLADLVDVVRREIANPGQDLYSLSDTFLEDTLADAFWAARLDGLLSGYVANETVVTPTMPREVQQIVIFYAAIRILRNQIRNIQSSFKAVAGPVSYETQQSSQLLKATYDDLVARSKQLVADLSSRGIVQDFAISGYANRLLGWEIN